ncbi:MAG: WecB/TagA/CpsF family glycosyltransferase [Pseudomonadota bacterium]
MTAFSVSAGQGWRIGIDATGRAPLLQDLEARLATGRGFTVATINLDHVEKLRKSERFRRAYAAQTHVVADGNPIVWVSRLAGAPVELIPGCELVEPMAEAAARRGATVALLGGTQASLDRAAERLSARLPGLKIVAKIAPPMGFDPYGPAADEALAELRESQAQLVFLALGAPKQEIFAARAQRSLPNVGFLSIGAGIDFISGAQKRAPRWFRQRAMEWLWRAASDPRRLAKRYARCAMLLPGLALDALMRRGEGFPPGGAGRRPMAEAERLQEAA